MIYNTFWGRSARTTVICYHAVFQIQVLVVLFTDSISKHWMNNTIYSTFWSSSDTTTLIRCYDAF